MVAMLALPVAAAADSSYSFIPVPAFDTDPNAGQTYGLLPVLLFKEENGQVRSILAPSVTYNEIRGVTGTFRYYLYPNAVERFAAVMGYSETIERQINLQYRNLGIFGGRFHADLKLLYDRDATIRFFGLGPESRAENESNMTLQTAGLYAIFGVNVSQHARLSLGETIQKFEVRRGGVPRLPFTGDLFPDLAGIDGAFIHAQRVAFIYDSRDSLTAPTEGLMTSVFAEASTQLLGSGADYVKAGLESIYLHPVWDRRLVVVLRGLVEAINSDESTPFEILPSVGGVDTLRGFSENRFFGKGRVVFSAEARTQVLALRIFGLDTKYEVAPFVDLGKVFNNASEFFGSNFEVTPGIGFRGLAPPSVVGHVEVGFSREGPAIYVGLDYPF